MDIISGKDIVISLDPSATGKNDNVIMCGTNATLSITQDTTETSCKGHGTSGATQDWKSATLGLKAWTMGADAFYGINVVAGEISFDDAFDLLGTEVDVVYGGADVGDVLYEGKALITSLNNNAPVDGEATWSIGLTGKGELVKTVVV